MGYGDHNPRKTVQEILQNRQRLNINIIGELIKQIYICPGKNNFQQVQSFFLPAGKLGYRCILHFRCKQKSLQHLRCRDLPVFCRQILCHIFDVIDHPLLGIHIRHFLCKISKLNRLTDLHAPTVRLDQPGNDLDQR